jgi:enoyl-[acyl-carrier protein] reductase I
MLQIDLSGKHALVAGVADDGGFGFAIAKALAEAGARVSVATWPPALGIFKTMLERGKFDASLALRDGTKLAFAKIHPLDAEYDRLEDVPAEVRDSRRYRDSETSRSPGSPRQLPPMVASTSSCTASRTAPR